MKKIIDLDVGTVDQLIAALQALPQGLRKKNWGGAVYVRPDESLHKAAAPDEVTYEVMAGKQNLSLVIADNAICMFSESQMHATEDLVAHAVELQVALREIPGMLKSNRRHDSEVNDQVVMQYTSSTLH